LPIQVDDLFQIHQALGPQVTLIDVGCNVVNDNWPEHIRWRNEIQQPLAKSNSGFEIIGMPSLPVSLSSLIGQIH
jgi:hypothetical protein